MFRQALACGARASRGASSGHARPWAAGNAAARPICTAPRGDHAEHGGSARVARHKRAECEGQGTAHGVGALGASASLRVSPRVHAARLCTAACGSSASLASSITSHVAAARWVHSGAPACGGASQPDGAGGATSPGRGATGKAGGGRGKRGAKGGRHSAPKPLVPPPNAERQAPGGDSDMIPNWAYRYFRSELVRGSVYNIGRVRDVLRQLQINGVEPTGGMFLTMVSMLANYKYPDPEVGFRLIEEMEAVVAVDPRDPSKGFKPKYPGVSRKTEIITSLILACGRTVPPDINGVYKAFNLMTARHPDTRELVRPDAQPDTVAFARFFSNVAQRASGTTPDDVAHVVAWFKAIDKVDDDGKRLFPNVEYTTEVFNSMLLVLSRQQKSPQLDLALQLYRDAQAGAFPGVVPDLGTFQNLLVAVARSNQSTSVDVALELFHDMVAEDADGNKLLPDALPNRFTFNNLLSVCVRQSNGPAFDLGINVFKEMNRKLPGSTTPVYPDASPDSVTYNTLLNLCAKNLPHARVDTALKVFKRMRQDGVQPDTVTFNTMLHACLRAKGGADVATAKATFQELHRISKATGERAYPGVHADAHTYNCLLRSFAEQAGEPDVESMLKVLRDMIDGGSTLGGEAAPAVAPTTQSWDIVLHALASRTPPMVDESLELLDAMIEQLGDEAPTKLLNHVLFACSRATPPRQAEFMRVLQMLIDLPHARPNAWTVSALIRMCARASPPATEVADEWLPRLFRDGCDMPPDGPGQLLPLFGQERSDELVAMAKELGQQRAKAAGDAARKRRQQQQQARAQRPQR